MFLGKVCEVIGRSVGGGIRGECLGLGMSRIRGDSAGFREGRGR